MERAEAGGEGGSGFVCFLESIGDNRDWRYSGLGSSPEISVRRAKALIRSGVNPPGNWFAPPGSNQSSSGGNETAEASGAEGRVGDLASL